MLLEARDICFQYPNGTKVLEDINFQIESGEIVGLIAPSGRGKSTFAKILAGFEKADSGSVLLDDKPINCKGYHPIQLIFQHPEKAVNPKWKMKKVLKEAGDFTDDMISTMGIQEDWMGRWPIELSAGELQRFCVLRVLTDETKFIIADEMTTMLDAITQAQIWNVVIDYAKKNEIGLIVISHEKALLQRICERIVSI